jgi:hypothetical protein
MSLPNKAFDANVGAPVQEQLEPSTCVGAARAMQHLLFWSRGMLQVGGMKDPKVLEGAVVIFLPPWLLGKHTYLDVGH